MYFESLCGFGRGGASRALRERHHAVPRVLVHEVRASLVDLCGRFLGEDVSDAMLLATSGRYEFHNKGIDVVLDSLAELARQEGGGRRVVLLVLVPAGNSGLKGGLREREGREPAQCDGPMGIATHNLFDEGGDPVAVRCAEEDVCPAPTRVGSSL